jgi:hypothetical protein
MGAVNLTTCGNDTYLPHNYYMKNLKTSRGEWSGV